MTRRRKNATSNVNFFSKFRSLERIYIKLHILWRFREKWSPFGGEFRTYINHAYFQPNFYFFSPPPLPLESFSVFFTSYEINQQLGTILSPQVCRYGNARLYLRYNNRDQHFIQTNGPSALYLSRKNYLVWVIRAAAILARTTSRTNRIRRLKGERTRPGRTSLECNFPIRRIIVYVYNVQIERHFVFVLFFFSCTLCRVARNRPFHVSFFDLSIDRAVKNDIIVGAWKICVNYTYVGEIFIVRAYTRMMENYEYVWYNEHCIDE